MTASRRRSPPPTSGSATGGSTARSTSFASSGPEAGAAPVAGSGAGGAATAGDLAIVLHSHMPYVEGFGTYPFGEEWLFDAVVRSYLPVLEVARDLTMTVTPVLADQLEDAGVRERLRHFLVEYRIGSAEADLRDVGEELKPACAAEVERYSRALELLDAAGGDPLAPFQRAAGDGRV